MMHATDQLVRSTKYSFLVILILWRCSSLGVESQLMQDFYDSSCPSVESVVRSGVQQAVRTDARMAASLLRMHFHDCMVQGCDGSILLDDTSDFTGEKTAAPNLNSVRGFTVIDEIKSELESSCPGIVSCSDILAIAARDSVVLTGGPSWDVSLGRRDSLTADKTAANQLIPGPGSNVAQLMSRFQAVGLSPLDVVTLSGAHTIGAARCVLFRQRFFNQTGNGGSDPTIDPSYLQSVQKLCPQSADPNTLGSLDPFTPTQFDNKYYKNLQSGIALLNSDQALFSTPGITRQQVNAYSLDQDNFFLNFAASMVRMGNMRPLTGRQGEIRQNCRFINSKSNDFRQRNL